MRKHFLMLFLMALLPLAGWAIGEAKFSIDGGNSYTNSITTSQVNSLKVYIDDVVNEDAGPGDLIVANSVTWYYSATNKDVDDDWGDAINGGPTDAGFYKATVTEGQSWVGILEVTGTTPSQGPIDLIVKPVNIEPTYGSDVPVTGAAVSSEWFTVDRTLTTAQLETLAGCLDFDTYDQTINKVGPYTYTLTIKNQGLEGYNIKVQGIGSVVVKRKPLSEVDWTNPVAALTFSGSAQTPTIEGTATIYGENYTLGAGVDYEVTYSEQTNAGTHTAIFTGKGNFGGTKQIEYKINPKPIAPTITVGELTFANAVLEPVVTVADGNTAIEDEGAFVVAYYSDEACENGAVVKNAGTYYAKVTFPEGSNYTLAEGADGIKSFTVGKLDISLCGVKAVLRNDKTYTGAQIKETNDNLQLYYPQVTTANSISRPSNYTVSYGENVEVAENGGSIIFTALENGNLTGTKTVNFNIVAASVGGDVLPAGLNFNDFADETYTSAQITPSTTGKVAFGLDPLEEGTDYTVAYGENINAGENAGSVIYTFKKNFTGSYTKTFNITPAPLTIKANDVNVNYGTAIPAFTVTYDGFVGEESEETEGIFGESELVFGVKATNDATAENVATYATAGTYYIWPAGLAAANYKITFASGVLTVGPAALRIVADNQTKTYGAVDPTFTYKVLDALDNEVNINFTTAPTFSREEGENVKDGGYVITPMGAVAANYDFTYEPGTLTINPATLTIRMFNQKITYGEVDANGLPAIHPTGRVMNVVSGYQNGQTFDDLGLNAVLLTEDAEGNAIEYNHVGEYKNVIVAKITNEELAGNYTIVYEYGGAHDVYTTYSNNNYNTFSQNYQGTLFLGALDYLALDDSKDDNLAQIVAYDGEKVDVSIKFSQRDARELPAGRARTWTANTWVTLTLPFDISVADLSKVFGYAIVNVVDPSRTEVSGTSSKFYGKLTMKGGNGQDDVLAANKPFMIKIVDDLVNTPNEDFVINFGEQTIVAPASADDLSVDAGGGAKFTGTYTTKNVTSADNADIWFLIGGGNASWAYINTTSSATWDILPFEGFIDMSGSSARNMTFYFEELDGSTTAIKSINADDLNSKIAAEGMYNLNGMKLNTVPTQKGVYILNGKKVVIK